MKPKVRKVRKGTWRRVAVLAVLASAARLCAQSGQPAPPPSAGSYVIAGTLLQGKGTPAAGQTVYLFVVRDGKVQGDAELDLKSGRWKVLMPAATSDARGHFEMELSSEALDRFRGVSDHFTLGGFVGVAQKDGKLDWILTREVTQAGKLLTFGPGSFSASRKLVLRPLKLGPGEFSVTGKVVDSAGVPIKGQDVYLLLVQGGKAAGNMKLSSKGLEVDMPHAATDPGGRFQIQFDADFVTQRAGARVQGFTVGRQKGSRLEAAHQQEKALEFGLDMLNRQTGRLDLGTLTFDSR